MKSRQVIRAETRAAMKNLTRPGPNDMKGQNVLRDPWGNIVRLNRHQFRAAMKRKQLAATQPKRLERKAYYA